MFSKKIIFLFVFIIASLFLIVFYIYDSAEVKKTYYNSGELSGEFRIIDGVKSGCQKFYYISGKKKMIVFAKKGEYDGDCTVFFENGVIKSKGKYKNGLLDGYWRYYDNKGELLSIGKYKQGFMVGKWEYLKYKKIINWQKYTSERGRFILNYPIDWNINDTSKYALLIVIEDESLDDDFLENFNVIEKQTDNAFILRDYVDDYYLSLNKEISGYKIKIKNRTDIKKDSSTCVLYSANDGVENYFVLNYFVHKKNRVLVFSFYTINSRYLEYEFLFKEIINSIEIM